MKKVKSLKVIAAVLCMIAMCVAALSFGACAKTKDDGAIDAGVIQPDDGRPDFNKIYEDLGSPHYCTVASDGSFLSIDTNRLNLKNYYDKNAHDGIKTIVNELGLPESLIEEMNHTRAIDGRQTETYKYVTVTWTYHPDQGLEVMFKLN